MPTVRFANAYEVIPTKVKFGHKTMMPVNEEDMSNSAIESRKNSDYRLVHLGNILSRADVSFKMQQGRDIVREYLALEYEKGVGDYDFSFPEERKCFIEKIERISNIKSSNVEVVRMADGLIKRAVDSGFFMGEEMRSLMWHASQDLVIKLPRAKRRKLV